MVKNSLSLNKVAVVNIRLLKKESVPVTESWRYYAPIWVEDKNEWYGWDLLFS